MEKTKTYYLEQMKALAKEYSLEAMVLTTLNDIVEVDELELGRPLTTEEYRQACDAALEAWIPWETDCD